jgi:hypothetical protein
VSNLIATTLPYRAEWYGTLLQRLASPPSYTADSDSNQLHRPELPVRLLGTGDRSASPNHPFQLSWVGTRPAPRPDWLWLDCLYIILRLFTYVSDLHADIFDPLYHIVRLYIRRVPNRITIPYYTYSSVTLSIVSVCFRKLFSLNYKYQLIFHVDRWSSNSVPSCCGAILGQGAHLDSQALSSFLHPRYLR